MIEREDIAEPGWIGKSEACLSARINSIDDIYKLTKNVIGSEENRIDEYITILDNSKIKLRYDTSILEIGSGYGELCTKLIYKYDIMNYNILDLPGMLRLAKYYIEDYNKIKGRCTYISCFDYEKLKKSYDLFISINCLTEIPLKFQKFLVKKITDCCQSVFICDDVKYLNYLPEFITIFDHFDIEIYGGYKNHTIWIGSKIM